MRLASLPRPLPRLLLPALLAAATLFPTSPLHAQAVRVSGFATLTASTTPFAGFSPGTIAYSFVIPANVQPDFDDEVLIGFDDVLGRFSQGNAVVNERGDLSFFVDEFGGGYLFFANEQVLLNVQGAQLFTGTPGNRTFRFGSFPVINYNDPEPLLDVQRAVTISAAAVPEPSSMLLVSAGTFALVWVGRTRRRYPM